MLLGPSSLSECFLTRKMDYSGNSISNKISIYLKEFQDFYWEYFAAVFPLWFTAAFSPSCFECACTITQVSREQQDGGFLTNPRRQISDNSPVKLEKSATLFCMIYKGDPEAHCMVYQIPVIIADETQMGCLRGNLSVLCFRCLSSKFQSVHNYIQKLCYNPALEL